MKAEREKENLLSSSPLSSRACPGCVADVHIHTCCSGTLGGRHGGFLKVLWGWWQRKSLRFQCPIPTVLRDAPGAAEMEGAALGWEVYRQKATKNLLQE